MRQAASSTFRRLSTPFAVIGFRCITATGEGDGSRSLPPGEPTAVMIDRELGGHNEDSLHGGVADRIRHNG